MARLYRATFREIIDVRSMPVAGAAEDYAGDLSAVIPLMDLLWPSGTDASELDAFWCDYQRTILGSATQNLDLKALAGGPHGTVDFVEVRAILLYVPLTAPGAITFAEGASNGWDALGSGWTFTLQPGTYSRPLVCPVDGAYPTGAADKVIDITNGSASPSSYSICILGATA